MFFFSLILILLAVVGYVFALNLTWWIQLIGLVVGIRLLVTSDRYRYAEIGQLFYLVAIFATLVGVVVGNVVFLIAHWNEPARATDTFLKILTLIFTP